MDTPKNTYPLGLTFDDVLLLPSYADFSRQNIELSTNLTKKIKLRLPFVSAPMDTVTESKLAIALAKLGGLGIIHRNLSIEDQVGEVIKVKKEKLLVGAAIGASKGFEKRVAALIKAKTDVVVVDSAHGFSKPVIETTKYIKNKFPNTEVVSGSVATYEGAKALIGAGADALRVGMGPGAICTTRVISGMGVPQVTALLEVLKAVRDNRVPVVADGGLKYSGDMIKALALGASTVMMGGYFASALESPGKTKTLKSEEIPKQFRAVLNQKHKTYLFKEYRGMGSVAAMQRGAEVKAEDEFHGKSYYKDRVLVAEGVEGLVPVRGPVKELLEQTVGGMKSGMYYVGAKNIKELWEKARFIQITQASLTENHPHDILITNPGENYS